MEESSSDHSSTPTLKGSLQRHKLTSKDVQRRCSDVHIAQIAKRLSRWKDVCPFLDISSHEITTIENNNIKDEEAKRKACLDMWLSKKGDDATYEQLLKVFIEDMNDMEVADYILKLVKKACQDDGLESDSNNEFNKEDMRFLCGCGQCSLESFIENGCPRPWERSRFPLLNISRMSIGERLELLGRLTDESEDVTSKFGSVVTKVYRSLKDLDPKELLLFLLPQQKFTYLENEKRLELQKRLREAPTVPDVMTLLTENFISWFNHPLLGTIVDEFLPGDVSYRNYVKDVFLPFIRRSLFEIPTTFTPNDELKGSGQFILKVNVPSPKSSVKGEIILPLRRHLSKNLGIAINSFDICSYDKGCLQFIISAPLLLLQNIFPISDNVLTLLSDFCYKGAQLKSIMFGQYHHSITKKDMTSQKSFDCFGVAKTNLTIILKEFASLVIEFYKSISDDTLSEVKEYLLNEIFVFKLRTMHQSGIGNAEKLLDKESLSNISTALDLVIFLNSYWSFHNYSLLDRIVRGKFGSSKAIQKLTQYIRRLEKILVAELPPLIQPYIDSGSYNWDDILTVKLKVEVLSLSEETLREIQNSVASQLDFEPHALLLKRIIKGTNELEILVPNCAVDGLLSCTVTHESISTIHYKNKIIKCCDDSKSEGELSDKDSGFVTGSSILSTSDDITSSSSTKKGHRKKQKPTQKSTLVDTTLSEDELNDSLPRFKPIHRSTSHVSSSEHETIVPEKLSPQDLSPPGFPAVPTLRHPPASIILFPSGLQQVPYIYQQHFNELPHSLSQLPWSGPYYQPMCSQNLSQFSSVPETASLLPVYQGSISPHQTIELEMSTDQIPSHKRKKTYEEVKVWKTNFQSRLEQTVLKETQVTVDLTIGNYKDKFYYLLCYEESACIKLLTEKCDGNYMLSLVDQKTDRSGQQFASIERMSNDQIQYATQASEAVFLLDSITKEEICKADISHHANFHNVSDSFLISLSATALDAVHQKLNIKKKGDVCIYAEFEVKHEYFDLLHKAVLNVPRSMICKLMPSSPPVVGTSNIKYEKVSCHGPISELNLDDKQLQALELILRSSSDVPLIVSGPFGSGKSRLLARTASELLKRGITNTNQYHTKILICAHHESTLDKMMKVLNQVLVFEGEKMINIIKISHGYKIYKSSNVINIGIGSLKQEIKHFNERVLLVITNYTLSIQIRDILASHLFRFTHILLDEGAQVREPEAIAALCLGDAQTKVVIAGDTKQDGPSVVVVGENARDNGLKISLLERLENQYDEIGRMNHLVYLDVNYRCHPALTKFLSTTVYKYPIQSANVHYNTDELHPKALNCPCFFHCSHIKENTPDTEEQVMVEEAKAVVEQMKELFERWPQDQAIINDTLVVSSTRSQLNLIRKEMMCSEIFHHNNNPMLRPSYTIQGHECHTVFLSTFEPLKEDGHSKNPTKTLVQPGIFNTVLSRSKQLVIAVGNPFTLLKTERIMNSNPQCWKEYLKFCFDNNTITYAKGLEKSEDILKVELGISSSSPLRTRSDQTHDKAMPTNSYSRSLSYQSKDEKKTSRSKKKRRLSSKQNDDEHIKSMNPKEVKYPEQTKSLTLQCNTSTISKTVTEQQESGIQISMPQISTPKQKEKTKLQQISLESSKTKEIVQTARLREQPIPQTDLPPKEYVPSLVPKRTVTKTPEDKQETTLTLLKTKDSKPAVPVLSSERDKLIAQLPHDTCSPVASQMSQCLTTQSFYEYRKSKEPAEITFTSTKHKSAKKKKSGNKKTSQTLHCTFADFDTKLPENEERTKNEEKKRVLTSASIPYSAVLKGITKPSVN